MKEEIDMSTSDYQPQYIEMQLSYSTADIENSIFFDSKYAPVQVNEPAENLMMLSVNGELIVLEEASPQRSIPLDKGSGLFRIVGLDQQP
jgi:hypothetical protein